MDRVKGLKTVLTSANRFVFNHIDLAPPDPILGTTTAFLNDKVAPLDSGPEQG